MLSVPQSCGRSMQVPLQGFLKWLRSRPHWSVLLSKAVPRDHGDCRLMTLPSLKSLCGFWESCSRLLFCTSCRAIDFVAEIACSDCPSGSGENWAEPFGDCDIGNRWTEQRLIKKSQPRLFPGGLSNVCGGVT